jgi:hypothetical protein
MSDIPPPPKSHENATSARPRWIKRRFLRLPIWTWAPIVVVAIGGVVSSISSDVEESKEFASVESTPNQVTVAPSTEVSTTTERVTTTTMNPGDQKDIEILFAATFFNDSSEPSRLEIIEEIESSFILERVDVLVVDVADDSPNPFVLRIEGSSGYNGDEYQIDKAWELVDYFSELWLADGPFRNDEGTLKPALAIVVDGRPYFANYDLMVRLAERTITKSEWLDFAAE